MKKSIQQHPELINQLFELLQKFRAACKQERIFNRVIALVIAELFCYGRKTITQLLMSLGLANEDWTAWYRLFQQERLNMNKAEKILFEETLKHVDKDEVYVTAVDGTHTPRTGKKIEGTGWGVNHRTPAFMRGIHRVQRWSNLVWMMPEEEGYSRAMPLRFKEAFTEKAKREVTEAKTEAEAAIEHIDWLDKQRQENERPEQKILMLADGSYDTISIWKQLANKKNIYVMARSAKNRVLRYLPTEEEKKGRGRRKYGKKEVPKPQDFWRKRKGWTKLKTKLRGRIRHFQVRVEGPFLRQTAPDTPVFLFIIRGEHYQKHGKTKKRDPVPYLINAVQDASGEYVLPFSLEFLLLWAWQRWEIEVCHRELKSNFGLGHKQCWHPTAAIFSVRWSALIYSILLLAAYRSWGLCNGPSVPCAWWQGSARWSFNTLWRSYRASFWGEHVFQPLWLGSPNNWPEKEGFLQGFLNSGYFSTPI